MATDLVTAFAQLKANKALAKSFSKNPEAVLAKMGVNTTKLRFTKGFKPGQKPPIFVPSGGASLTVCASIGFIVCATVGGEV